MNKWILTAMSVMLILSFFLIYLLSPSDSDYLARYASGNYETVVSFDVPLDGGRIVDVIPSLFPFHVKKVRMDIDRIEIRVNRNIRGDLLDYMRKNLKAELFPCRKPMRALHWISVFHGLSAIISVKPSAL